MCSEFWTVPPGQFHDDFAKRSQPFVDVVKQAKSTTVGTITEAGLESETADSAQVLVAVTVTTSNAGAPQPDPRAWRMRISVQKVGDQAKVSNVEFVRMRWLTSRRAEDPTDTDLVDETACEPVQSEIGQDGSEATERATDADESDHDDRREARGVAFSGRKRSPMG